MLCGTVGFPTEVLTDPGGEIVGLKDLERKHREIGNPCRTNNISPLDAVLLLNDDNVEHSDRF
jgi:hypothetical protein